jgi:hypothetical protein
MMLSILCFNVQYAVTEPSGLIRHAWHGEHRGKKLVAFSLHAHVFKCNCNEGTGVVGVTRSDPIVLLNQILATNRILDPGPESDHQTRSLRKSDPVSSLELAEFRAFYKTPSRRLVLADFYCRLLRLAGAASICSAGSMRGSKG